MKYRIIVPQEEIVKAIALYIEKELGIPRRRIDPSNILISQSGGEIKALVVSNTHDANKDPLVQMVAEMREEGTFDD